MSAEYSVGEVRARFELWFFRELVDAQRMALFALCGMPVDEIGADHNRQKLVFRHLLTAYADRIEADERAVPVAWQQKRRPEDYPDEWRECSKETFDFVNQRKESPWIVRELFDNPPAQAAQAECSTCGGENITYASHPHSPDTADSGRVDEVSFSTVEKVVKALCRIGHTFPESQEEQAARFESLVLDLCRSVQSHFDGLTSLAAQGQAVAEVIRNEAGQVYLKWAAKKSINDLIGAKFYTHHDPAASPAGVPDGYVLVPREPTETMIRIGAIWCRDSPVGKATVKNECTAANSYRAMIAAAPQPGESHE